MRIPSPPAPAKKKANHERWVISYADLLTLLLAFFVVLYASSTRNKFKMQQEAQSLLQAFHGTPVNVVQTQAAARGIMPHQVSPRPRPVQVPAPQEPHLSRVVAAQVAAEMLALKKVEQKLEFLLAPLTAKKEVTINAQPLTLTIQLDASVLFPSGQDSLTPPAVTLLSQVGSSLKQLPKPFSIIVQGYTDDQPIATAQFPSNWSLSAERSVSVVQLLAKAGVDSTQLAAEGFGQYAPIASNATNAGRAQNRRVVLVVHAPDPNAP
jgi:chemotaxis protein MotB